MKAEVRQTLDGVVSRIGGAHREGQQRMAEIVWDTLASTQHALIEAGTGTGKSLAYLVPALMRAVSSGERVVISTATLALQRQILTKDAPMVVEAVAKGRREPSLALLKGWNNYVCLHKLSGGYPQETLFEPDPGVVENQNGATSELAEEILRLRRFAEESETGDRDGLEGVSDRAWRQASVSKRECIGQRCPMIDDCFPEQARQAANQADVVITNHAMLGVVASGNPGALPDHDVLIIDEAHELPSRVTNQATQDLSFSAVTRVARVVRRNAGVATTSLDDAGEALRQALAEAATGRVQGRMSQDLEAAVGDIHEAARALVAVIRAEVKEAATSLMLTTELNELVDVTDRFLGDNLRDGDDVAWVEKPVQAGSQPRLVIAPLDVAGPINNNLLSDRAVVATSATLALGNRFEPLARDMGFFADYTTHQVESPFQYGKQGILYTPKDLSPPGRDGIQSDVLEELSKLIDAAGGRTLGLFSSRRAAVEAAEHMREHSNHRVLVQGEDGLPALVSAFIEDETSCLFGTLSLWQGVDVPGRACSLVVIDRIPFPRPDDPLVSARVEATQRSGGNGFMAVSATQAALLLAQGAGRLIRGVEDKGVVAILDSRVVTRRYGGFLRSSLPRFWNTFDGEVVHSALARLTQEQASLDTA